MPLVFVHGVATRKGTTDQEIAAFAQQEDARNRLFQTVAFSGIVPQGEALFIRSPYWGDFGAKFDFDLVSIPVSGAETFGPGDDAMAQVLTETIPPSAAAATVQEKGQPAVLLTLARQNPRETLPLALDALVAAAIVKPLAGLDAAAIAKTNHELTAFAANAAAYVSSPRLDTSWLNAKNPLTGEPRIQSDSQFVEELTAQVKAFAPGPGRAETFGGGNLLNRLQEAAGAIAGVAKKTAGAVAKVAAGVIGAATGAVAGAVVGAAVGGAPGTVVRAVRPEATRRAGVFFGDIFTYLDRRGTKANPGDIVRVILEDLRAAAPFRSKKDPFVVVAHSMGGPVVYDILTHYDRDLEIDLLLTVGSQVGVFKEMRLYKEDEGVARTPRRDRIEKPPNVAKWLNVFDPLDVLGFATEGVFKETRDFAFSTQASPLDAHTLYFLRPLFHQRLRSRMAEIGFGEAE